MIANKNNQILSNTVATSSDKYSFNNFTMNFIYKCKYNKGKFVNNLLHLSWLHAISKTALQNKNTHFIIHGHGYTNQVNLTVTNYYSSGAEIKVSAHTVMILN